MARAGARFFRGGAYKPRTSPYTFQGLAEEGLKILAEVRDRFGLLIVTEAIDNESLELVEKYADVIQIGARNMQNFSLLKRAGSAHKPVLLKRGMSATLEEFLMAAEYIMSEGNYNVILCERGVRTFADHTRNTLDLSVVPAVQRLSHLPIIVDPSHGTGKRNKVTPLSRAAVAVGADGLIIEVHPDPDRALSDGNQSLFPDQFDDLMVEVRQIAKVLGRTIADPVANPVHRGTATAGSAAAPDAHCIVVAAATFDAVDCNPRSARWSSRLALTACHQQRDCRARLPRIRLRHQRQEQLRQRYRPASASQHQDHPCGASPTGSPPIPRAMKSTSPTPTPTTSASSTPSATKSWRPLAFIARPTSSRFRPMASAPTSPTPARPMFRSSTSTSAQ